MSRDALPSKRCCTFLKRRYCALFASLAFCSALPADLFVGTGQAVTATEAGNLDSTGAMIEYRRIFVPAEKMDAWPRDGEKYLPIEAADFDHWIESANKATSSQLGRVTIKTAEYTARLENDGQLKGQGQWTIELRGDKPAFLSLGQISPIMSDPQWQNVPPLSARLGTWGHNAQGPERFGLEVPRSGVLKFSWHISPRGSRDQLEIPWQVPSANSTQLALDLPDDLQPRIDDAVLVESSQLQADAGTRNKPRRRWLFAISPSNTVLRISNSRGTVSETDAQIVLHEDVNYRLARRGLDIAATWRLEGLGNPQRELTVAIPRGLQLTSLKNKGRELAWHFKRDASSTSDSAIIELPKDDRTDALQITLNAWEPLAIGRPWRLPHLRPEGVFWSSGKFELSIAADYELLSLKPIDCVETGINSTTAVPNTPEIHSLTAYAPAATVEINLAERQPDGSVRAGSSLSLADPDLNGRLITQWNVGNGGRHRLTGRLAAGWIVEAVETAPADAMGNWFIDRRGGEQRIEIQLSRAASTTQNISVIVTGRLQRFSLAEPISAETLRMVKWSDARVARHLLTFQSNEPFVAEPVGNLPVVAGKTIDENDLALLDQKAGTNKVFDITQAEKSSGLQLNFRRGRYTANIDCETTYGNENLRQEYRLTSQPASSPIDRLLIYSTGQLGDDVRWTDNNSGVPLSAERLAQDDPQRANLPKGGEGWLVRLPEPTSRPFEVSASTRIRWPKRAPVPLLSLPEATEQRGRIVVRSGNGGAPVLERANLQTIPLPTETQDSGDHDAAPVCAAYRYAPAECLSSMRNPALWVGPNGGSEISLLHARHIDLESYFWPDGSGTHRATFELENHGATQMKMSLPVEARLVAVSINGRPLALGDSASNAPQVLIPRSLQAHSSKVSVCFQTQGPPLMAGTKLIPPLGLDELPFLAGDWTIWLPEDYATTSTAISSPDPKFNWRQRIFGLLGRPDGARPFDPLRLADEVVINNIANGVVVESQAESARKEPQVTPAPGWRKFHETFIADGPAPVLVVHPPATAAWVVVIMISCFLCARWMRRRRSELVVITLGLAAGLALLLPAAYADLAAGAVLGQLLAMTTDWPRRPVSKDVPVNRSLRTAIAGALVVTIVIGLAKLTFAQTSNTDPAPQKSPTAKIHRVLIPTDAEGRPSGTKYYVSEQFLRILMAAGSESAPDEGQWLLGDAFYSGELRENPGRTDIVTGNWTATFSIETLVRDTTVVLPLNRDDAQWNTTVMLDGIPLPLEWRDGGRKCAIQIAEPGRYSVVVSCLPKVTTAEGRNQFELRVPPLLGAKVELRRPESARGATVSHATIVPAAAAAPNVLSAELDPTDRLNIRWPRADVPENANQHLIVTELRWLHIKPAAIELETKYVIDGSTGRPDSLTIAYDDRWQLLTDTKPAAEKQAAENSRGQHVVRIPIPPEEIDRQEVLLRWQLRDPISLGKFRLPPIELSSCPTANRWLAITTDPSLESEIEDTPASIGTVNEFFAKWGSSAANVTPQLVLSNLAVGQFGNITIRPRETESTVEETLNVAAGIDKLRVIYQAKVVPANFGAYQFQLSAPPNLAIEEITARDSDHKIPLRWSRSAENSVTVFFSEELSKEYELVMSGSVPVDAGGKAQLPRVAALVAESAAQQVRLYRDDDVRVELEGVSASAQSKPDEIDLPLPPWTARPVAVCYLDKTAAEKARVAIKPNHLQIVGDTITALNRENGAWSADYRCQLAVEDGDLDVLRLRVPNTWSGPFDVQSPVPFATELKSVNEQTGILSIRFATTVPKGSGIDLRIRGPLAPLPAARVSVPVILPEALVHGSRYISVPDSVDSQSIVWTEIGVRPASVPQKLLAAVNTPLSTHSFEVIKDPFDVAIQSQASPQPIPEIRLADTAVAAGEFGGQLIVTRLILASHGLADCTLELPAEQKLVDVKLDARPAIVRVLDSSHWQLALGAAQLPQSLEIVSRLEAGTTEGGAAEFRRPALLVNGKPIPAEVSLWSFAQPRKPVQRLIDGANEVTAAEQAALRFDRLVSIAEVAKTTAAALPPPDGYNWFQPWAQLLATVELQSQQTVAAPRFEQADVQVSRTSEEQIARATERFDKWLTECRNLLDSSNKHELPQSADVTNVSATSVLPPAAGEWTYYVAEGGNDRLDLKLQPAAATTTQIRLMGLLIIIGLMILSIRLMRSPAALDFFYRWPHALGILLGITYWAWLWPSWLGLVIAGGSLWVALRFDWPGRSLRTEASTVLRANRPT